MAFPYQPQTAMPMGPPMGPMGGPPMGPQMGPGPMGPMGGPPMGPPMMPMGGPPMGPMGGPPMGPMGGPPMMPMGGPPMGAMGGPPMSPYSAAPQAQVQRTSGVPNDPSLQKQPPSTTPGPGIVNLDPNFSGEVYDNSYGNPKDITAHNQRFLMSLLLGVDPRGTYGAAEGLFGDDPFAMTRNMMASMMDPYGQNRGGLPGYTADHRILQDIARQQVLNMPTNGGLGMQYHQLLGLGGTNEDGEAQPGALDRTLDRVLGQGAQIAARDEDGNFEQIGLGDAFTSINNEYGDLLDPTSDFSIANQYENVSNLMSDDIGTVNDSLVSATNRAGKGLVTGMGRLNNRYEKTLLNSIDAEAQKTLALQSPELQAQMEMAGLGRSGANQMLQGSLAQEIMGQANRDKYRALQQFADTGRGLDAQAQLASFDATRGALGQAAGQGLQGALSQANLRAQGLSDLGNLTANKISQGTNFHLGAQQNQLNAIQAEMASRQNATNQLMALYGMGQADAQQKLNQMGMFASADFDLERARQQNMQNMAMLPLQYLMTMATGTTSGGYRPVSPGPSPFAQAGLNMGAQMFGNMMGGGAVPQPTYPIYNSA